MTRHRTGRCVKKPQDTKINVDICANQSYIQLMRRQRAESVKRRNNKMITQSEHDMAARLLKKAASLRAKYESKASLTGDSAEINIPFSRKRTKAMEAGIKAVGKFSEAMRLESEAAAILGKPDPHASAVITDDEKADRLTAEAEKMEADASLYEQEVSNHALGSSLFDMTYNMKRQASFKRRYLSMMKGESVQTTPMTVAEFADLLLHDATEDEAAGLMEVSEAKRRAAGQIRDGSYVCQELHLRLDAS